MEILVKSLWAILAVLAVAVFLRTYRLNESPPGLHADEAFVGNCGLQAWRTGDYRVFYESNGGVEGLMVNVQGIVLGLAGRPAVWVLRLPGALLGTLTVFGVYLLGRKVIPGHG